MAELLTLQVKVQRRFVVRKGLHLCACVDACVRKEQAWVLECTGMHNMATMPRQVPQEFCPEVATQQSISMRTDVRRNMCVGVSVHAYTPYRLVCVAVCIDMCIGAPAAAARLARAAAETSTCNPSAVGTSICVRMRTLVCTLVQGRGGLPKRGSRRAQRRWSPRPSRSTQQRRAHTRTERVGHRGVAPLVVQSSLRFSESCARRLSDSLCSLTVAGSLPTVLDGSRLRLSGEYYFAAEIPRA